MPTKLTDIERLKQYISGVMERATHHADEVGAVGLALVGAIIWRKDRDPIEVMEHQGDLKNVLWVKIGGHRYAFSYKHRTRKIEMRKGTTRGRVIHRFSNSTPLIEIEAAFRKL